MDYSYNTLLFVDDDQGHLDLLERIFRDRYNILKTRSPLQALDLIKENQIQVVISDHKMPEMDGVEFLSKCHEIKPDTIRIMVTAYSDSSILLKSINCAKIYQYIKKPYGPEELSIVVESAIEYQQLKEDNKMLVCDLKDLFSGTIMAIIEALDAKDSFTLGRSKRVTFYSLKMGQALNFDDRKLSILELAGLLHDIGMIGVNDDILSKSGVLTDQEYEEVKLHVNHGVNILSGLRQLDEIVEIIKYHHERFDGQGYPYKIGGDQIPIFSRIISIADTFDSLVSNRAYRNAMTPKEAFILIKNMSGTQFDPNIVKVFEKILPRALKEISIYLKNIT